MREEFIWVEKYRPHRIEDVILPDDLKARFLGIIAKGDTPNLLFYGRPGTGKTTVARALLEQMDSEYLFVPASLQGNIDMLRTTVTSFASSVSFNGKRKYVILDEADYLSHTVQPALRNFIEQFSKNAGFILTCNYENRVIGALDSRTVQIDFNFSKEENKKLVARFYKRVIEILEKEKVPYDKKVLASYIQNYVERGNLDFRKIINELQGYANKGEIDVGILNSKIQSFQELLEYMKKKDFTKVRTWVATESNNDTQTLLREFYDQMSIHFTPQFIPELVEILGDAQYISSMVIDQEICMASTLVKIMANATWKE